MIWKGWIDAMLGRTSNHVDDDARVKLDRAEMQQAERLSRLTGRKRDDVLAEAYRRADEVVAGRHVK